jgi:CspA family cold shock protein
MFYFTGKGIGMMTKGIVRWFNGNRGYGFIEDESGRSIYVNRFDIKTDGYMTLVQGDRVWFEAGKSKGGAFAKNVSKC